MPPSKVSESIIQPSCNGSIKVFVNLIEDDAHWYKLFETFAQTYGCKLEIFQKN